MSFCQCNPKKFQQNRHPGILIILKHTCIYTIVAVFFVYSEEEQIFILYNLSSINLLNRLTGLSHGWLRLDVF